MFESLMSSFWEHLTPNLGTIALGLVGIGIALGVIRKIIDHVGQIPVLIGIGVIVISAWAVRYLIAPAKIEVREIEKEVIVPKLIIDTSSIDALKGQLKTAQRKMEALAVKVNAANHRAATAEAVIEHRDAPKVSAKAAFDERFAETQLHPVYEVTQTPQQKRTFTITVHESIKDYLVTSLYQCDFDSRQDHATGNVRQMTITAYDKDMKRVGKPRTLPRIVEFLVKAENGKLDTQELASDLADREVELSSHDEIVRNYIASLEEHLSELQRRRVGHIESSPP